jgi:hypothetical protein
MYQGAGVLVPVTNGVPGLATAVVGTGQLNAITCPNETTCFAVGSGPFGGGLVVPVTSNIPGSAQSASGTGGLNGISCLNATTCEAIGVDQDGSTNVVLTVIAGTPGTPEPVYGSTLFGVACGGAAGRASCVVVGSDRTQVVGEALTITNGRPSATQSVPSTSTLNAVACVQQTKHDAKTSDTTSGCLATGATTTQGVVVSWWPEAS